MCRTLQKNQVHPAKEGGKETWKNKNLSSVGLQIMGMQVQMN